MRTFADWNKPPPGFLEMDLGDCFRGALWRAAIGVLHPQPGGPDLCAGSARWNRSRSAAGPRAVPLKGSLVVEGLEAIGRQLPFSIRGIDSDNDSAFISETLIGWCNERGIEFTRSRAYRKNDQAWIEQKNGAVVRRFVGTIVVPSLLRPGGWPNYGTCVRCGAPVCELLPALVQAGGKDAGRRQCGQALQPTGHALRPVDAARHSQCQVDGEVERIPGPDWTQWHCCTPSGKLSRRWCVKGGGKFPRITRPQV